LQGINLVGHAFYLPINLNGNHWVLVVMEFIAEYGTAVTKLKAHYFDPLGHAMPPILHDEVLQTASLNDWLSEVSQYGQPLQQDGFNCGPWVVEFARAMAPGNHSLPQPDDINERRSEHLKLFRRLHAASQSGGGAAGRRPRKRRKTADPGSRRSQRLFGSTASEPANGEQAEAATTRSSLHHPS
jgi:hypothetical protein